MLAFISIFILFITAIYVLSNNTYRKITASINKKEYPLKKIIPVGLYIMDILNYKYESNNDRKILQKFTEIKGANKSIYYLKIHWANRVALLISGLLIVMVLGLLIKIDMTYFLFGICLVIGLFFSGERDLENRVKKRHFSIMWDFPDFVNKLALLVNAGLTVSKAWEKVVKEDKTRSDFYLEAEIVITQTASGESEFRAYEDFARRCRTIEIARFVSIIIQNVRKGNAELASILRVVSNESWETRKNTAKRLGEEASSKMVIPMMIMFVAIILIVSTPAVLSIVNM